MELRHHTQTINCSSYFFAIPNSARLKLLSYDFLIALRLQWDSLGGAISTEGLDDFYKLSIHIDSLVPSPSLQETWNNAWSDFSHAMRSADDPVVLRDAVAELVQFLLVLIHNEPRWLALKNFPVDFQSYGEQIIAAASQYNSDNASLTSGDEYEAEAWLAGELAGWLEDLPSVFPAVEDDSTAEAERIRDMKATLENRRDERHAEEKAERESEERDESEYWEQHWAERNETDKSEEPVRQESQRTVPKPIPSPERLGFSIAELFHDL